MDDKSQEGKCVCAQEKELDVVAKAAKERAELLDQLIEISLDNRKFEIDLLWKRSNTFWLFSAALLVAIGYTYKSGQAATSSPLLAVFAASGLVFSFIWSLVNHGSKFWQESWEEKTALYFNERYQYSDLLSRTAEKQIGLRLLHSKNFSLSRLMIMTSHFFVIFWTFLVVYFVSKFQWSL